MHNAVLWPFTAKGRPEPVYKIVFAKLISEEQLDAWYVVIFGLIIETSETETKISEK